MLGSNDGTNWTNGGNLNTARALGSANGTLTAGLFAGGYTGTNLTNSESYNGTSWTNAPTINTARRQAGSAGTQTAAVLFTGYTTTTSTDTEEYDGSSWTTVNPTTVARDAGLGGGDLQTSAFIATGNPGVLTEHYNGTIWSAAPNVATARNNGAAAGTTNSGLGFGGYNNKNNTVGFTTAAATLAPTNKLKNYDNIQRNIWKTN